MLLAVELLAHFLDSCHSNFGSLLHSFSEDDGVSACCEVLHSFVDHCLSKYGSGCGSVSGNIIGLGSDFLNELCAHVLEAVFKLDLLSDGNTVIGDERCTVALVEHYISSLRSECYTDGICKAVYTLLECLACLCAVFDLFSHLKCASLI